MQISKNYLKFIKAKGKVDIIEGTTQAGKTTTAVPTKFLYKIKTTTKKKHIIAAESLGVIVANILSTGELGLCDIYPEIEIYLSGNKNQKLPHLQIGDDIVFLVGYDNIARFKKVLGGQFGAVYVDEMNIANDNFINELFLPRFEYFCGTLNPGDPKKLVYKEIINRSRPIVGHEIPKHIWEHLNTATAKEGWNYWFFTYNDNPSVTQEKKDDLLNSLLPSTMQYKTKILGIRANAENLIYGDIPKRVIISEQQLNEVIKPSFKRFVSAIDTSYSKKTEDKIVWGFGGITQNGIYIRLDELVVNNKDVGQSFRVRDKVFTLPLATSDVCLVAYEFLEKNKTKWCHGNFAVKDVVIDSPATVLEFDKIRKRKGWSYRSANANFFKHIVKVIDRIDVINNLIAIGKYLILEHCKNHIDELESYSYSSKGEPVDANNHTIDEQWYEIVPFRDEVG